MNHHYPMGHGLRFSKKKIFLKIQNTKIEQQSKSYCWEICGCADGNALLPSTGHSEERKYLKNLILLLEVKHFYFLRNQY